MIVDEVSTMSDSVVIEMDRESTEPIKMPELPKKFSNKQIKKFVAIAKKEIRKKKIIWHKNMDKKFRNDSKSRKLQVCPFN